jgi:hypothetical protein
VRRHKLVSAALLLALLASGCASDAQRQQSVALLDQLSAAHSAFGQQPQDACDVVGNVQTRLYGEPGLSNVQPAWGHLRDAAAALQAVCGQTTLLAQPSNGSLAMSAARQRWTEGIQRENGIACDHLRQAAAALGRTPPC